MNNEATIEDMKNSANFMFSEEYVRLCDDDRGRISKLTFENIWKKTKSDSDDKKTAEKFHRYKIGTKGAIRFVMISAGERGIVEMLTFINGFLKEVENSPK